MAAGVKTVVTAAIFAIAVGVWAVVATRRNRVRYYDRAKKGRKGGGNGGYL